MSSFLYNFNGAKMNAIRFCEQNRTHKLLHHRTTDKKGEISYAEHCCPIELSYSLTTTECSDHRFFALQMKMYKINYLNKKGEAN